MLNIDIEAENKRLKELSPEQIIEWAVNLSDKKIITTSFGVYSAVLLSSVSSKDPSIEVVWCDTGFNDYVTYKHANFLIEDLKPNMNIYAPKQTRGFIEATLGYSDDPKHELFTELVKLEPLEEL